MGRNWKQSSMSLYHQVTGFVTGQTSITVTHGATPSEGDVLLMQIAHTTILDPTGVTLPSGWNMVTLTTSAPGNGLFIKTATASEPSSYTFSTLPSGNYGWAYFNLRGVFVMPDIGLAARVTTTVAGTYTTPSFTVCYPGIGISVLGKSTTTAWDPSPGSWSLISGSGQGKAAYRIFTDVDGAETITWALTPPGATSTNICHLAVLLDCNYTKH